MSPSVMEAMSAVVDTGSSTPLGAAILPGGVNFTATFEES
jgi:hypothetical protein